MCRFLLYLGPPILLSDLITTPTNSLIHQSYQSREGEEPLNGDGFGVAWYVPDIRKEPGAFRSVTPAWSSRNLFQLADVTRSPCVLAHVRAASTGLVSESNCHPFVHQQFSFMHNGGLAGFVELRRKLLHMLSDQAFAQIQGTTDSEFIFAYFLDRWREDTATQDPATRIAQALKRTIHELTKFTKKYTRGEASYLNLAVSDGKHAAVSRHTTNSQPAASLHLHTGKVYHYKDGVLDMLEPQEGHGSALVASEKLSEHVGWKTVPLDHIVVVRNDHTVEMMGL